MDLAGAVWTHDGSHAQRVHSVAAALRHGTVRINGYYPTFRGSSGAASVSPETVANCGSKVLPSTERQSTSGKTSIPNPAIGSNLHRQEYSNEQPRYLSP